MMKKIYVAPMLQLWKGETGTHLMAGSLESNKNVEITGSDGTTIPVGTTDKDIPDGPLAKEFTPWTSWEE